MPRAKGAVKANLGRPPKVRNYKCFRCGTEYESKDRNFNRSNSPIFHNNERFLPICKSCVIDMYEQYKQSLGSEKEAIRRMCLKLDIYWNEKIYQSTMRDTTSTSRIIVYMRITNLKAYADKNYDNTLAEEAKQEAIIGYDDALEKKDQEVPPEIVEFWGSGLTASYYRELEQQLKKWTSGRDINDIDIGEITVIKKICLLEVMINQDIATGNNKAVEKNVRALDVLLGSANLKPVQRSDGAGGNDSLTPFGVWIKKIENERPIPEPEEQFKDVDGIAKYISVWFLGHLSKVLNISNRYSNLYEDEIAKLTVERPEYEGYDDEEILEDIFERARKDAEIEAKRAEEDGVSDGEN